MLGYIRQKARKNPFLRRLVGYHLASSGFFDNYFLNYKVSSSWEKRINDVLNCSDNNHIPRVPNAGQIKAGKQIMHNGITIRLGSYYGPEYARMLLLNKGVHEPQEERVFSMTLKQMPENAVMIEMGAFWSFYSLWFHKEVKGATNFMIEPDAFNMGQGKRNFALNKFDGKFFQAFIGREPAGGDIPVISVDQFMQDHSIPFVHMLHSDIQGFEFDMLHGAERAFSQQKIGYVFVSTHSNEVHNKCLQFLKEKQFIILANANLDQTFSEDGLIAARAPYFPGIDPVPIALKK